jgi:type I restriction enzyme R subunit
VGRLLAEDQAREDAAADATLQQVAFANPYEGFHLVFRKALEDLFIDRMEQNESIFARYMNDAAFRKVVEDILGRQVYDQIRTE